MTSRYHLLSEPGQRNSVELLFILAIVLVATFIALAVAIFDWATDNRPEAEKRWLTLQADRCVVMRSSLHYNPTTKTAECWRTPFMRRPKLEFAESYKEEPGQ